MLWRRKKSQLRTFSLIIYRRDRVMHALTLGAVGIEGIVHECVAPSVSMQCGWIAR